MDIRARFISRTITVVIPSFLIIVGIFVVPFLIWRYVQPSGFLLTLGANIGGLIALIVVVVLTNPLFVSLARRKRGKVSFQDPVLRWKAWVGNRSLDLSAPHSVLLQSGPGIQAGPSTSIQCISQSQSVNLNLADMDRARTITCFPDAQFIDPLSRPPREGPGGFVLRSENPGHVALMEALLKAAWDHREQNKAYNIFRLFPWDTPPAPDSPFVQRWTDEAQIAQAKQAAEMTIKDSLWVLPDWLLIQQGEELVQMPLGHIDVQVVSRSSVEGTNARVVIHDYLQYTGKNAEGEEVEVLQRPQPNLGEADNDDYYKELFLMDYIRHVRKPG